MTKLDDIHHLLIKREDTLTFKRELAAKVGLNEAIVIQQMLYWNDINQKANKESTHLFDERWWVYNTWAEWRKGNFPFWSARTIKRTFDNLVKDGYIIAKPHENNRKGQWFALDLTPDKLSPHTGQVVTPTGNTETTTETTITNLADATLPAVNSKKKETVPAARMNPMKDAIVAAFGWEQSDVADWGAIIKTAKNLCGAGYQPDDIPGIYAHVKAKNFPSFTPAALSKYAADWKSEHAKTITRLTQSQDTAPEPEPEPVVSDEDRRASVEALRQVRQQMGLRS